MNADGLSTEEWVDDVVVVRATGAIDMLTAPQLQESIQHALDKGPAALVVDLTAVDFLASAGMQVLVWAHNEVSKNARFAVVADGPATSRPLKITGLTDVIALFATLDSAIETFAE